MTNRESARGVEMFEVEHAGESLVVISVPIPEPAHVLTDAEHEVARDAIEGLSNAEIAQRRRRSARTIANQLASIYRKLGVTSRCELAALLSTK
ncbi:MAG: helix-turn-helix transcriptional regulator [Kofleriaceae bacterium]|nr:helix-turn-helix transcriptional regulator [Kofleriaceae bacterium]